MNRSATGTTAIRGIFVLGLFATLYVARGFFLPLVLAILSALLLRPLVRTLRRWGLPEPIGAALIILLFLAGVGAATYQLSGPAAEWLERAPGALRHVERELRDLKRPVEEVRKAAEQVERMTDVDGRRSEEIRVSDGGLEGEVMQVTRTLLWQAFAVIFLLYFLLASGDLFLRKTVRMLPRYGDKKQAVEIARQVEKDVSTYLFTITLINFGLGCATVAVLYLYGLPNPFLWGVLAGLLNFVPYLGAAMTVGVLLVVALVTFQGAWWAVAVAATFWSLTALEGYLLTPLVLSRRLTLNPVVVLVGIIFWGWLWGVGGVLLAVPLLAIAKIVCDRVEGLATVGEYLGP